MANKNCIELRDSKKGGYTVALVSGSVNPNGKYEETANSKQVLDTPAAVWKNILSTINNANNCHKHSLLAKIGKNDLRPEKVFDMTSGQKFTKSGFAVSGLATQKPAVKKSPAKPKMKK